MTPKSTQLLFCPANGRTANGYSPLHRLLVRIFPAKPQHNMNARTMMQNSSVHGSAAFLLSNCPVRTRSRTPAAIPDRKIIVLFL